MTEPTIVVDDAVEIQAGGRFTCARRPSGQVFCWGGDDHAQLGSRDTEPCGDAEIDSVCAPTPQPVKGLSGALGLGSTRPTSANRPLAVRGLGNAQFLPVADGTSV